METINTYVATLRKLARTCDFGAQLDDAIRDQLVCGLSFAAIQKRLLSEATLDCKKAVEIAIAMEAAAKDTHDMMGQQVQSSAGSVEDGVHRAEVRHIPTQLRRGKSCYRWRNTNHLAPACWHKETVCASCKKKGHISAMCRSRPKQAHAAATSVTGETKYVSEQTDSTVEEREWRVLTLKHTYTPPILALIQLPGKEVTMEVDTGASVSLMPLQQWKSLGIPNDLDPVRWTLRTYTGESVAVLGQVQVKVRYQQQEKTLPRW